MAEIAVLGLGAMGSRMASNLLKAGHDLVVWNRAPAAADGLVAAGARLASTPREAAADAEFVMALGRGDAASRQVWLDDASGALGGMARGAVAIESSTLTPGWVRELGGLAGDHGVGLMEAPVSGSLSQAKHGQLIYMIGGEEETFRRVRPVLRAMGSTFHLSGPLGAGAMAKLCTNALLGIQTAAIAELIGMLRGEGADPAVVLDIVASTPVWSPVASALALSMLSGSSAPQFPIELIERDVGNVVDSAPSALPVTSAARAVFQQAIDLGLAQHNMTAVSQLFPGGRAN